MSSDSAPPPPRAKPPPLPTARSGKPPEQGAQRAKPDTSSSPDLNVNVGPAGRETLAAIADDLATAAASATPAGGDEPLEPGRNTLTALAEAIAPDSTPRRRQRRTTQGYESRPEPVRGSASSAMTPSAEATADTPPEGEPVALAGSPARSDADASRKEPSKAPVPPVIQTDDIRIDVRPAGRETLAAIEDELAKEQAPAAAAADSSPAVDKSGYEIFEMVTFVVRGGDLARLSSQAERREFVTRRLMHRLPVDSPELVDRVDVTPWTVRGTVIVRVWCRVQPG